MRRRKHQFSPDGSRYFIWTIGDLEIAFPAPADPDAYFYDYDEGQRWVDWHQEYLTHCKGHRAGEPIELLPWLEILTRELYGWRCEDDGFRRYQENFTAVPRKNAKTEWGSGAALGAIAIDDEPVAEAYLLSSDEDQAGIAFGMCQLMIKNREDLQEMFEPLPSALAITHPESDSILRVLPGRYEGQTGTNPSFLLVDEEHELKNGDAIKAVWSGSGTRRQRLKITITTAGRDKTAGPCWTDWVYARQVRDLKVIRDRFCPLIFEAPEDCNPGDERIWKMCNPGYGRSVLKSNFEEMWLDAQKGPTELDSFKQFQLNIWVTRGSGYLNMNRWDDCFEEYTEADLYGRECYGGLDIGATNDMTAFHLTFPFWDFEKRVNEETGREETVPVAWYKQLVWYWCPQAALEASHKTEWPYSNWLDYIEVTGGEITDFGTIRKRIQGLKRLFHIRNERDLKWQCGFDPKFSTEMVTALMNGIGDDGKVNEDLQIEMIKIPQTHAKMSPATVRYRDLVQIGKMKHNGNPVLSWNARNAMVETNSKSGTIMVHKGMSKGKIDGISAALNGLTLAMDAPPPPPPRVKASVW